MQCFKCLSGLINDLNGLLNVLDGLLCRLLVFLRFRLLLDGCGIFLQRRDIVLYSGLYALYNGSHILHCLSHRTRATDSAHTTTYITIGGGHITLFVIGDIGMRSVVAQARRTPIRLIVGGVFEFVVLIIRIWCYRSCGW